MSLETIESTIRDLADKRVTSAALTESALARIRDPAGEGPRTFIRLFEREARAAAAASDTMRAAGVPLPALAGIPLSVKDLFDVARSTTTAGSVALADAPLAQDDAPVVARLRAAGAIILGTTNMTEFAFGGLGLNPHYGTPRNPFERAVGRIPGGSSSGAAVAVTDGMAIASIGSDTAGSVRMPAALCGIVGFKPTARRVPIDGTVPLAVSLDSIGVLGASVACCGLVDSVIAGDMPNGRRAAMLRAPMPLSGVRFAVATTMVLDDLEPAVADAFSKALTRLSAAGARITEIALSELGEFPALHAKGGFPVAEGYAWHRQLFAEKRDLYDQVIASRLATGAHVTAAEYIDLCNARARLIQTTAQVTRDFDAVLMPTVPVVAPPIAAFDDNADLWLSTNRRLIRNPGVANFLDRCALTIPCHAPGEAPVGLTLMGEAMADDLVLSVGASVERMLNA